MIVHTHQWSNGEWKCFATLMGYDYSFTHKTATGAQDKMRKQIVFLKIPPDTVKWEKSKNYSEIQKENISI